MDPGIASAITAGTLFALEAARAAPAIFVAWTRAYEELRSANPVLRELPPPPSEELVIALEAARMVDDRFPR